MNKPFSKVFSFALILALVVGVFPAFNKPVQAISTTVVISEFRVRGQNGGNDEFIELFNLSSSSVNIGGWKIKGSNDTGGGTTTPRATIPANTILNPGCYYLLTNSTSPSYSGSVPGNQPYGTGITDTGGIAVTMANDVIVDQVGMSTGSAFKEGTPLASLGTSNLNRGYERKPGGVSGSTQDTDDNTADFQLITPSNPQNLSSTCVNTGPTPPTGVGSAVPSTIVTGGSTLLKVAVTPGANPTSTGLEVTADLSPIGGSASQVFYDDATNGDVTSGDNIFSYQTTAVTPTACGASLAATITDDEERQGNATIALTVQEPATIHEIQGASHISSLVDKCVRDVTGIVTVKRTTSFYMQDPNPDSDDSTSEGILVFMGSGPTPNVGDAVSVTGRVQEFRPGSDPNNLTTTELSNPGLVVSVLSTGNPLPAATVIGSGGRIPPSIVINNDGTGNVENSGTFDAGTDGVDFYESMEGMLVQVNNAVAVGPSNDFGEIPVLGDDGANGGDRTARDGIVIQPGDFNPERIILDDVLASTPNVNVGDTFPNPIVGVMDYSFGNFKLLVTSTPATVSANLQREVTGAPTDHQLSVASFNVENLRPSDPPSKFEDLADLIVYNLKSPDVIGLEEIQDNTGATNNGVVDADVTLGMLVAAIQAAGGPEYEYRQINPVNNQDGGEPGGNIRVGFLFNPARVTFVDRPGGTSTGAVGVVSGLGGPELTFSPGRIDPTNTAFSTSRKPLAGEFVFRGDKVFVVVNHFNSKGGDNPLFGPIQPPILNSEIQRLAQAQVVNNFVDSILALDSNANVIVLGDLNDFQFSAPLATLKGGVLVDLVDSLPLDEQYTYVFDGNSQVLDHILASNRLANAPFSYDIVHVNSEFHDQISDHEPEVALMCVDRTAPSLMVAVSPTSLWPPNHKYVNVTATVLFDDLADSNPALTVSVTSNEPDNGLGDGDTPNDIVIVDDFHFKLRAERSGAGTGRVYTITYQVTDGCGNVTTQSATVTVPHNK